MGGDGGVIAANRRYMRNAGQANSTGDYVRSAKAIQSPQEIMTHCSLTGAPLPLTSNSNEAIVCCRLGKFYMKEAAIESLLKKHDKVWEVRSRKELYPVRFHYTGNHTPSCPVTLLSLNGTHVMYVIAPKQDSGRVNVISEKAIREVGIESLQEEFGKFSRDDLIRIAPSETERDMIREKVKAKRQKKEKRKQSSNKIGYEEGNKKNKKIISKNISNSAVEAAKNSIATAVASKNSVLSSIFNSQSDITEKEKKDNLFAR